MVTAMDDAVGMVIDSLKDNNMLDNTVVVFSSDVSKHLFHMRRNILVN